VKREFTEATDTHIGNSNRLTRIYTHMEGRKRGSKRVAIQNSKVGLFPLILKVISQECVTDYWCHLGITINTRTYVYLQTPDNGVFCAIHN